MWEFEIWQEGLMVASGSGPDPEDMEREAMRYFNQYVQDGFACMILGKAPLPSQQARLVAGEGSTEGMVAKANAWLRAKAEGGG